MAISASDEGIDGRGLLEMKTKFLLCGIALLLTLGCSTARKPLDIPELVENISVQRVPAAEVSINRVKADEQYDFYIALLVLIVCSIYLIVLLELSKYLLCD